MAKQVVAITLWTIRICLAAMLLCGCTHRTEETPDRIVQDLRSLRPGNAAEKERIESAIALRQNGTIDPTPLLFTAYMRDDITFGGKVAGFTLGFIFYDEDEDVVGCVIREEHTAPDGARQIVVEQYPVFMYYPTDDPLQLRYFPIRVRTSDQQKDNQQWTEYIQSYTVDDLSSRGMEHFLDTLPPVYISVPEPNRVDVLVSLYDRAGHESDPVVPHYVPYQTKVAPR